MKLKIYGADWCSPCKKSKQLCEQHNVEYEFFDISASPEALEQVKELLGKEPKTIPQIFNEDGLIGDYDHLKQLLNV